MAMDDIFLGLMLGDPAMVDFEAVYVIPPSSVHPQVKELGVGVPLLDASNVSTLFLSDPLNACWGDEFPLHAIHEINFSR
jgi:hypothetical protein